LRIESKDGVSEASLVAGRSYARKEGVEHDVVNANPFEFVFIEVELKEPAKEPSPA
jgi:beta-alanine degradation protein BauB